ncbi:MAG: ABC transporter permease [Alphaproteobacteria bacterium]|nr:ABC transporter permease [Alphaproteobacteria bacterium]
MTGFLERLWATRNLAALLALAIVVAFIAVAIAAPLVTSWESATRVVLRRALQTPSAAHVLGTDELGRDLLSRVVWGARVSLLVAVLAVAISLAIGVAIGALCGYFGGRIAEATMRAMDFMLAFPRILLAIIFITVFGPGMVGLTLAIGISTVPIDARLFRAPVLSLRQREFVLAARALGAGHARLIGREILPNTASLMIVQGTISLAEAILIASGLSFLGLGPEPPTPEWGAMIAASRAHILTAPHVVLAPGLALFVVILAFNVLGDALRDYVDPRVRSAR